MAEHTPGPWTVYEPQMPGYTYGVDGPVGQAVVYLGGSSTDGIPRGEDARLIASAPDLLAALEALVAAWESLPETVQVSDDLWARAKTAIAQARGR